LTYFECGLTSVNGIFSRTQLAQHHFAKISAGSGRIIMTPGEGTLGGDQCCKNTGNFCLGNITGFITVFLVILGNICKNIAISNKSSENINCMYSATLKIYTFDRNLKNFTL
jgi:hypothetical protein